MPPVRNSFPSQGILSFSWTLSVFSDPPYGIQGRSVPPVRKGFAPLKDFVVFLFLDTFRIQRIMLFCLFLDTLRIQRILLLSLFLDTFRIQGILLFSLLQDTFRMAQQRILSFSCFQTLSVIKGFCNFPVSGHFP